jgi:hypothetical protein
MHMNREGERARERLASAQDRAAHLELSLETKATQQRISESAYAQLLQVRLLEKKHPPTHPMKLML